MVDQVSRHQCTQAECGIEWTFLWTLIKKTNSKRQLKAEQILACPRIFEMWHAQRSGSSPVLRGKLSGPEFTWFISPGGICLLHVLPLSFCGNWVSFSRVKCQRDKEAPLKRSFPMQKGNISAYPLNNNIQPDSLATDPKKERRPRKHWVTFTHTPLHSGDSWAGAVSSQTPN